MAKLEVKDQLLRRAKQRQQENNALGLRKSLFDCAAEIKMEDDMKKFSMISILQPPPSKKINNNMFSKEGGFKI